MQTSIKTLSTAETEAAGEALARELIGANKRRACIALYGEMGVGKTAFVRGFARAMGGTGVKSPTYTVVNEYKTSPVPIFHFDLYRIADGDELYAIGFDDYLSRDGYALCEWSENIIPFIPDYAVTVTIVRTDEGGGREITIKQPAKG